MRHQRTSKRGKRGGSTSWYGSEDDDKNRAENVATPRIDVGENGGGDLTLGSSNRGQHHVDGENDYESISIKVK